VSSKPALDDIADEQRIWRAYRESRDPELREKLFAMNLDYAKAIAARLYRNRPRDDVEFKDYYQFACVGLLESIDRYIPDGEAQFRTYCTRRIEGNVLDGIERLTDAQQQIALSRRMARERLDSIRPRYVSRDASSVLTALAEAAVGLAIGFMLEDTGMYAAAEDEACRAPSAYDTLEWRQARSRMRQFVDYLPPRERQIIQYHYLQGLRFEQIASLLGISAGRVSQLHREAILSLRSAALTAGDILLIR
jgi:RNA polymerase sigma factor FliA